MDYAGWELERQRQALAALLLGGGTAEDRDTSRKEGRRSPEADRMGSGAAQEYAAGKGGRYAGGPDGGGLGAWETVRLADRSHVKRPGGPGIPVSAWEGVLGAEAVFEPGGKGVGADAAVGLAKMVSTEEPSGGGTENRDAFWAAPFRQEAGGTVWETGGAVRRAGRNGKSMTGGLPLSGQSEAYGPEFSETGSGGRGTAGGQQAGEAGAVRRSGGSPEQSRAPVVQVLEEAPGAGFRSGGLGDAALQAEDRAKSLSLAVQRDARRYDGGFMIY